MKCLARRALVLIGFEEGALETGWARVIPKRRHCSRSIDLSYPPWVKKSGRVDGDSPEAEADLKFEECTAPVNVLTGGELEIHNIAGSHNGTVTAKNFVVTVVTFGFHCAYGAGAGIDLGTFTSGAGGTDGTLVVNTIVNRVSSHGGTNFSIFCPATARWTASYTQTTKTDLYVTAS